MGQWKLISELAARERTKNNFRLSRNADFPVFLLTPTMERINIEHCQKPCFGTKIQCHLLHVQGLCFALCFKKMYFTMERYFKMKKWNVLFRNCGNKTFRLKKKAPLHSLSQNHSSNCTHICKWIQVPWKLRCFPLQLIARGEIAYSWIGVHLSLKLFNSPGTSSIHLCCSQLWEWPGCETMGRRGWWAMEGHRPAAAPCHTSCHGQVQPLLLLRCPETCPRVL